MTLEEKKERNKKARLQFEKMFKKKSDVAKELDMFSTDFSSFLSGSKLVGGETLQRIEKYLNETKINGHG